MKEISVVIAMKEKSMKFLEALGTTFMSKGRINTTEGPCVDMVFGVGQGNEVFHEEKLPFSLIRSKGGADSE